MSFSHCSRTIELVTERLVRVADPAQSVGLSDHRDRLGSENGDWNERGCRTHHPDVAKAIRVCWNVRGSLEAFAPVEGCRPSLPTRSYVAFVVQKGDPRPLLAVGPQDLCRGRVGSGSRRTNMVRPRRD